MSGETVRVGLCDDSVEVRRQLGTYLSTSKDLTVCGSYGSGPEAIAGVPRDGIDVLLLDVRMPGMTGPDVARKLAASGSPCKVIYLTSYPESVPVRGELRHTVRGALTKSITPEDLVQAIVLVADDVSILGKEFEELGQAGEKPPSFDWAGGSRQREVLVLVREGLKNKQIAAELGMSTSWVKQTISKLCRRAGVASRTGLAAYQGGAPSSAVDGD